MCSREKSTMLKSGPRLEMIKMPRHGSETFGCIHFRNDHPDSLKLSRLAGAALSLSVEEGIHDL